MKIGIALFAYNRYDHLRSVLEGLKVNTVMDTLYIFQDGLKTEAHRENWERTQKVIEEVDWCTPIVISAERNQGLATSIVKGIHYVLNENDAVIVLEDDCVPSPDFVNFMHQCFEKYERSEKVYQVNGYSWDVEFEGNDQNDAYFMGRMSSWGWGTWKNRWVKFSRDYEIIRRIQKNQQDSDYLQLWGGDLINYLIGNIKGTMDSWAVFWAAKIIEEKGLCVGPYVSLIDNIGFDGTGEHCGVKENFKHKHSNEKNKAYRLPECEVITEEIQSAYDGAFSKYKVLNREPVILFGCGVYSKGKYEELNHRYSVVQVADNHAEGNFYGLPIERIGNIVEERMPVVIMIKNMDSVFEVIKQFMEAGVDRTRIRIGILELEEAKRWISYEITDDGKCNICYRDRELLISSAEDFRQAIKMKMFL